MKRTASLKIAAAALVLTMGQPAMAQTWPRMSGGANNPQCQQAFQLAKSAFESENAPPFIPIAVPKDFGSTMNVNAKQTDLTENDLLAHDPTKFERMRGSGAKGPILYWQIKPEFGKRLVVVDVPVDWRGDSYFLYLLDEDVKPASLFDDLQTDRTARTFKPVLDGYPALVLADNASGRNWFIDTATVNNTPMPYWSVYTTEADGVKKQCTIRFMPKVKQGVFLLPAPVQRIAALLDEALGPDTMEGTMHTITSLRNGANDAWANVASRPWALTEQPANTSAQVYDALGEWSTTSRKSHDVIWTIIHHFREARHSLARYYQDKFHMPPRDAKKMADFAMVLMEGEYFLFPGAGDNLGTPTIRPNPWAQLHHS